MNRLISRATSLFFVMTLIFSLPASAAAPMEIQRKFKDAGCRVVNIEKVARTDLDAQVVWVAWCSGVDVYLEVLKCRSYDCRIVR